MRSISPLVLLATLQIVTADGLVPIDIKDMLFPAPPVQEGGKPPSVPLSFIGGVPTAKFSMGTPPQKFTGIFDTGAPITWAVSSECTQNDCPNVPADQRFNRSASTTNTAFDLRYDFVYIDGTRVTLKPELDTVTLAETIEFPRHFISEAYVVSYPPGFIPAANARIGAGAFSTDIFNTATTNVGNTKATTNAPKTDTPSTNTTPAGGIARRAAGDDRMATGASSSGSPTFKKRAPSDDGFLWVLGTNPEMYTGTLYDLPLVPASSASMSSPFWNVPLSGLQLSSGRSFPLSNTYGRVSSSIPYILVPPDLAKSINQQLGAMYDSQLGLYTLQCSAQQSAPKFIIQFAASVDAYIPPQQYIIQMDSGRCYSAITPRKDNDHNIELGGPFFRSFYIEYSFADQEISVANSAANTGAYVQPSSTQQQ